jgi:hypothetical protein
LEGLREARNRLKPGGMISFSFAVLSESLGRKIYLMLQEVFDGRSPVCVYVGYEGATFLISNDPNWALPARLTSADITDLTAAYANPSVQASVSTDDWPFFYMPQRVYPVTYLIMISQILVLSLLLVGNFFTESPRFSHLSFFFLGVGFMLVETKGITEMGLTFGNARQVIGIVIAGILTMAFLGNCLVQWLNIKRPLIPLSISFGSVGRWLVGREVWRISFHSPRPVGDRRRAQRTAPVFGNCLLDIVVGQEPRLGDHGHELVGGHLGRSVGIQCDVQRWPRLSEQFFRIDKWSVCRG